MNNPRPVGNGLDYRRCIFHGQQAKSPIIFQCVDGVENFVMETLLSQLAPKRLHWVELGQDPCIHRARGALARCLGVGVFVPEHCFAPRAHRLWCPAAAHIVDAPQAGFVLKHPPHGWTYPVFVGVLECFEEFYSSCATGSLCGWHLSGTSFRQW